MTQLDQNEIEKKWQKIWEEKGVFDAQYNSSQEKFFGTVPYPYANSILHIGHGRTYTAADILTRFQRVLGKNVLFPMAYHISGTPVLAVADGIKRGDEKQIKMTRDAISDYITDVKEQDALLEKFKDPNEIAEFFSKTIESSLKSIGVGIDWRRQFSTGDEIYNKFVEWQYHKLYDLGILIQDKYPILYSAQDGNAVGEDDIKDGDLDKVSVQEMAYIKFKLVDDDAYMVAATLRPDSIFGATNIYSKLDMDLVKLKVDGKIWIVSKASQIKIEHQFDSVEFISEHKGEEFVGKEVIVPIIDKKVPVYATEFPDENHGTGIVYSSPADSLHDYIFLFETLFPGRTLDEFADEDPLKLTPITETYDKKKQKINYKFDIPAYDKLFKYKIFSSEGQLEKLEEIKQELYKEAHFGAKMINCGEEFDGTPLKANVAKNKTEEKLKELGLGGVFYETSRRAVTRGGDQVIVANLPNQWFLNYSSDEIKQKAFDVLDHMTYFPKQLKDSQRGYLEWVSMRPCARRRGIGTPLPFDTDWIIEPLSDSTIYPMLYLTMHIIEREQITPEQFTQDLLDYIYLGKGNITLLSEETKVSKEVIEEMRAEVNYWRGFDLRYTASSHMSNHLSFLIYHYGLIFNPDYYPNNISIGGLLIKNGEKISKSKGNGIPLSHVREKYGVDMYRLYIAVASNLEAEMDFRDDEIHQLQKRFDKFKELMNLAREQEQTAYENFSEIDKWLISKFYTRAQEYFECMPENKIRQAYISILYEFLNDINYHQRRTSEEQTTKVLRFVYEDYLTLMTPVVPHICEELYEGFGETEISLKAFTTDSAQYIDQDIEAQEGIIENVVAAVGRVKETNTIQKPKKITLIQASDARFKLFDKMQELLAQTREFKELFPKLNEEFPDDKKFIQKFLPKTLGEGLSFYLSKQAEAVLLNSVQSFFEEEFACKIEITDADSYEGASGQIVPSKPGVVVE